MLNMFIKFAWVYNLSQTYHKRYTKEKNIYYVLYIEKHNYYKFQNDMIIFKK